MASKGKRSKAAPRALARKAAPKKTVVTKAKATAKRTPVKRAAPRKRAATTSPPPIRTGEPLGSITCPSGTLGIFDIGLMGYLPRPALEPAIVKAPVPANRELRVIGERVGRGRFADCWDHIAVVLREGEVHGSKKLDEAGVDFARLVCMDHGALDAWQHEDSLDGLADVMFWGRDELKLAKAMRAPRTREGYGWTDLPLADAEAKILECERLKADNKWLLATDFRPHSHHFHALAAARANANGAGEIELGDARMLLFFTSWGDGVYPIYLDTGDDDQPLQIRIQLATKASNAAMRAVDP